MNSTSGSGLRRLAVTTAATVTALVSAGGVAQAAPAALQSQEIRTFADKCFTVRNQSAANSVPIDQFQCQGDFAQQFSLVASGSGTYYITTFAGKCLTVRNQSAANSVPIDQFTCQNDFAQRFSLVPSGSGTYYIRTFAGKCLTVRNQSAANSVPIDQFTCQNDFAQRFSIAVPA
ncbi:RICIN domain-containing protein [Actinoplanes awajinensis]|uniref:Ricin B lectin domain-containing protein n=1 Tax=Actinoplanes awajinensis subsp. mycoplanecinus TaxID=135947 RepID=A0A117MK84_9ACTN|nr:RICIN domain-containing protein [Actinoplanes awajinensis]KUL21731.1 hypothetical protein ADL15_50065 [Actinoplanes awajinensis subsp. mycoplanecinus]